MTSLSAALLSAAGAAAAVGRVRAVDSLSPPDLVFFAQSAASAARGEGFAQTALRFDHGGLTTSVHLSPWRLAHALAQRGLLVGPNGRGAPTIETMVVRDPRAPGLGVSIAGYLRPWMLQVSLQVQVQNGARADVQEL